MSIHLSKIRIYTVFAFIYTLYLHILKLSVPLQCSNKITHTIMATTAIELKAKADLYSENVRVAFNNWLSYFSKLDEDTYGNPQGKNRHATVLHKKFVAACEAEGLNIMTVSTVLTMLDELN